MKVFSYQLTSAIDSINIADLPEVEIDLVIVHAFPYALEEPMLLENIKSYFPKAFIAGCSTAGELFNGYAYENSIVISAIQFNKTTLKQTRVNFVEGVNDEYEAGRQLSIDLVADDLQFVLIYSEGLMVDCDELVEGIKDVLGNDAPVFGGLAGDNLAFENTVVIDRDGVYNNSAVAIGFYGDSLKVDSSTSEFYIEGTDVEITKSNENMVLELNNKPALEVYASIVKDIHDSDEIMNLNFPLLILDKESKEPLYCRTVLEYSFEDNTLLAGGSLPEGPARILKLTHIDDYLFDAKQTSSRLAKKGAEFAIVITCAGRRGAMGGEWIREFPIIAETLGDVPCIGFYSYGEIGKCHKDNSVILHNQTLNIATFYEV